MKTWCLLLAVLALPGSGFSKALPFIFLGVTTEAHPQISQSLKDRIFEKLETITNLDIVAEEEIIRLQKRGVLTTGIPDERKTREISEAMGSILLSSAYLNKLTVTASQASFFSLYTEVVIQGNLELTILETGGPRLLFSGVVRDSIVTRRWFSGSDDRQEKFLDAIDRDKYVKKLLTRLADQAATRIKQVTFGISL